MLLGVFVLLGVSVAAIDALESLLRWLLRSTGSIGLATVSGVLSVLVNVVLAAALMVAVPRLRMSRRRLRPSMLFVAVGITLLNTVGRYYVVRTERNPAYTVVAGAVGLLLYLYLLNQLLLFGAALAATSEYGRVVDLAGGKPPATGGLPARPRFAPDRGRRRGARVSTKRRVGSIRAKGVGGGPPIDMMGAWAHS